MSRSTGWNKAVALLLTAALSMTASSARAVDPATPGTSPGVLVKEFVFEKAPFAQCHAATLVETPSGLVAAWFAGTREGHADVGIWLARQVDRRWLPSVEVADGIQSDALRHPCWNPVLERDGGKPDAELRLYYKVGPSPSRWWGMVKTSKDDGKTWSAARRLPEGILGPIKNKAVRLDDGTLLSGSSTEHEGWRVHLERSTDDGTTWTATEPLNDGKTIGAIQPAILKHKDRLQILCRSRQGRIAESWSEDDGKSWSEMALTSLPNNNSGLDAVALKGGRSLLVYNHTTKGRSPLNVSVSRDGKEWHAAAVLENEPGEYSYPAVIQTSDGLVHIAYTWKRTKIRHVVIDPAKLTLRDFEKGQWPTDVTGR